MYSGAGGRAGTDWRGGNLGGGLSIGGTIANPRLNFGGSTAAFAALDRSTTNLRAVLADGSALTSIVVATLIANAAAFNAGAGTVCYGSTVATTVGAAGAAAAIPVPVGYIIITVAGSQMKIPYCNP